MILKTVLERIDEMPDISFNRYFVKYIMQVQDDILAKESPRGDIRQISELIVSTYKELVGQ